MRRYGLQIQSYVIEQRKEGKPWKTLAQEVKEKFGITPPTARAMQKWVKRGLSREEMDKMLTEEAKRKLPEAAAFTQHYFSEVMLPAMWHSQAVGADLEQSMWMMFLSAMESVIGEDKFERFIDSYMKRRTEVKEQARAFSPFMSTLKESMLEKERKEADQNARTHSQEIQK
jgi:hypothetical protein